MTDIQALGIWRENAVDDPDLLRELAAFKNDESTLSECFGAELSFGTGGLRGIIGAGNNRMNIYTVRKATQGLARYILSTGGDSAAIAYDSRNKSALFAREAARVFAANGITANLYPRLAPTPALSFAVRHLGCAAGVCVTASHNPAEYNGYKVYGPDGCQITLLAANAIQSHIAAIDMFSDVRLADFDKVLRDGLIRYISEDTLNAYLDAVKAQRLGTESVPLKVVYTPLNGAGLECVTRVLRDVGVSEIAVVPEQEQPDGNFPTCPYPNPEERAALSLGLKLCGEIKPDLLLATDPDCDRVGIAVPENGDYRLLSGNETGILLFDYICKRRLERGLMPERPVAVKTVVTTDMAVSIAKKYGVELREVLTGFKFIGEQIGILEQSGDESRFIFGFEESYGYLSGGYVRDKDAVGACMLICEMAWYHRQKGKTPAQALDSLYREHGYYKNDLVSVSFKGANAAADMRNIMRALRSSPPETLGDFAVTGTRDYLVPQNGLPASDMLEYSLESGLKAIIRPSGTEPKVKVYLSARGQSMEEAAARCARLSDSCGVLFKNGRSARCKAASAEHGQ